MKKLLSLLHNKFDTVIVNSVKCGRGTTWIDITVIPRVSIDKIAIEFTLTEGVTDGAERTSSSEQTGRSR